MEAIDITPVLSAGIVLIGLIFSVVIFPWIKANLTSKQWDILMTIATAGVQAAEIILSSKVGAEKREWVTAYIKKECEKRHIKFDEESIRIAIENAWKNLGLDKNHKSHDNKD